MNKLNTLIIAILIFVTNESCSKKTHPAISEVNTNIKSDNTFLKSDSVVVLKKNDSLATIKPLVKRRPVTSIPKVIVVNDKFAKKSVDGRFYYDLQGRRYWRSNRDGKYYLFNKSMLTDDAFKKPQ